MHGSVRVTQCLRVRGMHVQVVSTKRVSIHTHTYTQAHQHEYNLPSTVLA